MAALKILSEKDATKSWVTICTSADDALLSWSASGKAIELPRPRHTGEFWCPASLIRRRLDTTGLHADEILVPTWFCIQNRIEF